MDEEQLSNSDKEELLFLREENRSRQQVTEIVSGLSGCIIFVGVLYWICSLAMIGAKYAYSDFYSANLAQVMIFGFSSLIVLFYVMFHANVYSTICDDAGIWIADFIKKFQAASKAWTKAREELEEKN
jgi:hypothetical protein